MRFDDDPEYVAVRKAYVVALKRVLKDVDEREITEEWATMYVLFAKLTGKIPPTPPTKEIIRVRAVERACWLGVIFIVLVYHFYLSR